MPPVNVWREALAVQKTHFHLLLRFKINARSKNTSESTATHEMSDLKEAAEGC